MPGYAKLAAVVDGRISRAKSAMQLVALIYPRHSSASVLDLGCGEGGSRSAFLQLDAAVEWRGVDIEDSPEVNSRTDAIEGISAFDGVNLPYQDDYFDIIYCHQVLEHVAFPHELMKEVARVLRPGGAFVGSVSYLEPYHSFSNFNFTPMGFLLVTENAGLETRLLNHCSGLHYKMLRQMLGGPSWFSHFSRWSSWWFLIELFRIFTGSEKKDANVLKLQYCSTFSFHACKAG